jgi:multiple sugar transport system substrate-binding protein
MARRNSEDMTTFSRRQFLTTAATAAGAVAAPHVWIRPAWAQGKEVRVLAWTHFVPAYDKWFDSFAEQWSTQHNMRVIIDHVPHLQIPAKIAAEIATQSGHDIVQLVGSGTEKWAAALTDVQDLCDKLAKKYGGFTPLAENYSKTADGKFHSVPDFFIDFPGLYRKDLWGEIGMPNGPDGWEDLRVGGAKLKTKGFPVGIGLAHHDDSRASWRAIMWSFGASEVAKDGKTITYNSKEIREALKFNKALYKEAMTPEVLAWDDASNNRFLASGRGSWIHNPISAYRSIEGQNKELADKIFVQLSPKGPATRRSFANCRAYGVTKFSKNADGAKAFLESLVDNYREGAKASTGYNMPFLKAYAKPPFPIISDDPKLKPLEQDAEYHFTTGYPGTLTPAADEVYQQFVMVDALAQFCADKLDLEGAVRWGEEKIKSIYGKFA